jgi:metal-dependent amidase/aminoacylase/carboxypeptidase family protein
MIYSRPGAMMASPDEFNITIQGKGGHGAKPHETIDPVVIMAEFIMSAQKIVSRGTNGAFTESRVRNNIVG